MSCLALFFDTMFGVKKPAKCHAAINCQTSAKGPSIGAKNISKQSGKLIQEI